MLRFQAAVGLRREESLKIRHAVADRGEVLALQPSWTKGGRAREIPIRSDELRVVLTAAKRLVGQGSLTPADLTYVAQLRRFEHHCARAGILRVHGHRHHYAQQRYRVTHGMGGTGGRWAQVTGADAESEGAGSGSAQRHQSRE